MKPHVREEYFYEKDELGDKTKEYLDLVSFEPRIARIEIHIEPIKLGDRLEYKVCFLRNYATR